MLRKDITGDLGFLDVYNVRNLHSMLCFERSVRCSVVLANEVGFVIITDICIVYIYVFKPLLGTS